MILKICLSLCLFFLLIHISARKISGSNVCYTNICLSFHIQQNILSICQHSLSLAELITQIRSIWPDLQYHFKNWFRDLASSSLDSGMDSHLKESLKENRLCESRAEQSSLYSSCLNRGEQMLFGRSFNKRWHL